jgi:Zn finger protein HypA/HybF involved in hydrogenase expression
MTDPTPILFDPRQQLEQTALSLAIQHKLVDEDGRVWCWHCESADALLPSLHCPKCLGAHYAKHKIVDPQCINRQMTEADRAALRGRRAA